MTVYDLATMKSMNEVATLHALLQSFGISASEGQDFKVEGSTTLRKLGQCVPRLGQGWQFYKRNEGVIRKDDGTCAEVFCCIVGRPALWPYPASVQGDEYQPFYLADLVTPKANEHEQATHGPAEEATPQDAASPLDALRKLGIIAAEGEAFTVVGHHAFSLVSEAVCSFGRDWRVWAYIEKDDGNTCTPRFRCVVGRADRWPFPSEIGQRAEGWPSPSAAQSVDGALLAERARDFYAAHSIEMKPSAALTALLDATRSAARAEGYDLGTALTRFADLCDRAARPNT